MNTLPHDGLLTKVSEDGKYGMLISDIAPAMKPLQDLQLQIGQADVYAKVEDCHDTEYMIGFTMVPDGLMMQHLDD